MGRPKNPIPRYTLHKSSGQARIFLHGKEHYLGEFNSQKSLQEYARIIAELRTGPAAPLAIERTTNVLTVDQVLLAFWRHADKHYRRADGTSTNELKEYSQAYIPIRELYGLSPVVEFGPLALKAVRQRMIETGLCRTTINNRIRRLKHVFKWAVENELVTSSIYHALAAVSGLQKGRTEAPEPEPVLPVDESHVRAILPHVRPQVRGMIEVQSYTGMRPAEVTRIRPCDIDQTGTTWLYRPIQHKGTHQGRAKVIVIGPQAQAILRQFTPGDKSDYYFSPRRAVEELHAERRRRRKTPLYPSHMSGNQKKRKEAPEHKPAERYSVAAYDHAVKRGVVKANRALIESGVEIELHIPHWAPNQLRHAHATEVRKRYGLEASQATLGHSRADTTQIYALRDLELAMRVANGMG